MSDTGFYVKISEADYLGPFSRLSEARDEARSRGSDLEIYHGNMAYIGVVLDDRKLSLIHKVQNG